MADPQIFKTSSQALSERRRILGELRWGLILALGLGSVALADAALLPKVLAWTASAVLALGLLRFKAERLLESFALRELRVQDSALELLQGRFTRLLFFSQIEQLRMIQSQGEKVLAIELRTLESAVTLRGYENMEALFGALSARKPSRVMIEVEEVRFDRGSPAFWARLILISGGIAILAVIGL